MATTTSRSCSSPARRGIACGVMLGSINTEIHVAALGSGTPVLQVTKGAEIAESDPNAEVG